MKFICKECGTTCQADNFREIVRRRKLCGDCTTNKLVRVIPKKKKKSQAEVRSKWAF